MTTKVLSKAEVVDRLTKVERQLVTAQVHRKQQRSKLTQAENEVERLRAEKVDLQQQFDDAIRREVA